MSEKEHAYIQFYEVERIPDIGFHVKNVMDSCKTIAQLCIAYKWGTKTIREKTFKITDGLSCRSAVWVEQRKDEVIKDIQSEFDRYAKKL